MERPASVTVIAGLFFAVAGCLIAVGVADLSSPGALSLTRTAGITYGRELDGPGAAISVGAGWALVAWGLFRLHNWARWAAMLVMVLGVAALVPTISMADIGGPILWYGLQIALRVAVGWYLAQAPAVVEAFAAKGQER